MDYKQSEGSAVSWRRAKAFSGINDLGGERSITFHEEDVVQVEGSTFKQAVPSPRVRVVFDPNGVIPLRDPVTNQLTGGTAPQSLLLVLLHSAYMMGATAADAGPPTP